MPTLDKPSPRRPLVALALTAALALAPACGDSGNTSMTGETTAGETTGTTGAATTDDPTTGAETGSSTSTGPGTGSSTTGDPAVCDGSMPSNAFECVACTECGSWTTPIAGSEYPPALVCVLEGLRDDRVVGADSQSCDQGKCLVERLLSTGMTTVIGQQMVLDQNDQSMMYLSMQELEFKDATYFETCLAAYDVNCTSPNNWFTGTSLNVDSLVCP